MSFKEYVETKKKQLNAFVKNQQKKQESAEQRRDADLDRQIEQKKARSEKSERTYKKLKTLESYDKKIQRTETFNKKSNSGSSLFGLTNQKGFGVSSKSEGSMFGNGDILGGGIFDTGKSSKSSGSILGGIGIGGSSSGGMLDGVFGSSPRKHNNHHNKKHKRR